MLKLVNIKKDYVTKGVPTVHALKGLTVNFRRNEFVAILGASGCGKTTLLNIIGGLDRYTSGDLKIEGKSTKDYTDYDWDTYRNHSVGFVFQSYNLISHQSVLGNVELALTISGVSKEERRQRALEAIKRVGLEGMEKKRPNQLSGGQMQRVAIARALVNDPEILLADEPTGALDSETSVQIMDLLKDVASDRLVIMVTHNPDLAYKYANRIVKMSDGLITDDSNPYSGETKEELERIKEIRTTNKGSKKKTSMSFFTATGLSFFNLLSKLKRTILITVAGSIGIIGVSSVLAVSSGVSNYIGDMQDDMLSRYPLTISEKSIDTASLMNGLATMDNKIISDFDIRTEVGLDSMIMYLMDKYSDFTNVKVNEINEDLIKFVNASPTDDVAAISLDYGVDLTNNIFASWKRNSTDPESETKMMSLNGLTQMYIAELKTVDGFSEYARYVNLFTNFMKQIPGSEEYILSQYDLVGQNSHFPHNENEILLVADENQTLTDLVYAQLGFYSQDEFLNIAKKAIEEQKENPDPELLAKYTYPEKYKIDDIIGKKLAYYPHDSIYNYNVITKDVVTAEFKIDSYEVAKTDDLTYNKKADTLDGQVTFYLDESTAVPLDTSFVRVEDEPVDPSKPLIGNWVYTLKYKEQVIDFALNFTSETNVILTVSGIPVPPISTTYTVSPKDVAKGYMYNAEAESSWTNKRELKIAGILKRKEGVNFGCLDRGVYFTKELANVYMEDAKDSQIITNPTYGIRSYIGTTPEEDETYKAYVQFKYTSYKKGEDKKIDDVDGYAMCLNSSTSSSLTSLFSFMGSGANFDIDKGYIRSLSGISARYDDNNVMLLYDQLPAKISIYPKNFESKKNITKYLDTWNQENDITLSDGKVLHFDERKELTYDDTIEIIINIINTLITTITVALVAFTSLSLVVSCFMIAVITYISTMERVKEIGVIRSLGGRKKDVSRLFIAECLIIGLSSGVFGIIITYILSLILNLALIPLGVGNIAALPIWVAAIMIGVSIVLNVLSGLIPAMKASNQDPVVALRSE